ncbi:hypothetical protein TgHK011_002233 [Trichoderma gracile]|nr:hypothetical protein TgHK011_002233 [Trichoderma gracile]
MLPVQDATYLVAPNWTYLPGGSIALGNIVFDPFRPQHVLSKQTKPLPETETAMEYNWKLETEKLRSVNVGIWTRMFDQLRVKLRPMRNRSQKMTIYMKALETVYFKELPSKAEIQERVNEEEIRSILHRDSIFRYPVYMVTGIKIARGFQLVHEGFEQYMFGVNATGIAAPQLTAGAGVGMSSRTTRSDEFLSGNAIIFAYQLMIIKPKGWGERMTYNLSDFHHKAALLVDDDDFDEDVEEDMEFEILTACMGVPGCLKSNTVQATSSP